MFFCYCKANISKGKTKNKKHLDCELQYYRNEIHDFSLNPHWFLKDWFMKDDENNIKKPNMSYLTHT